MSSEKRVQRAQPFPPLTISQSYHLAIFPATTALYIETNRKELNMSRQFGIITTTTGITGIVVNSLTTNNTAEIAEARNEKGQVTDLKAYSKGETISVTGLLDGDVTVEAGAKLTLGEKDYIIETVDRNETNIGFVEVSLSARTADAAEIAAYTAPSAG